MALALSLQLVSRHCPFTREDGSGTTPLLELFHSNAINIICALAFYYACFTLCGGILFFLLIILYAMICNGHTIATKANTGVCPS